MKNKIHIGGEPFMAPLFYLKKSKFNLNNYLNTKYKEKYFYLTGGAYFSIVNILRNISLKNEDIVLLPSFLCPTILKPFKKMNIKYSFYKISHNLEIDMNDLYTKINRNVKGVYYINYFGFPPNKRITDELNKIKGRGIYLFEDCAQGFLPPVSSIGDFKFNSFRKFIPVDGSLLISSRKLKIQKGGNFSKYLFIRHFARFLRYLNKAYSLETTKLFLNLIALSDEEKYYYNKDNASFNYINQKLLSKFNFENIKQQRTKYFIEITKTLKENRIFDKLVDGVIPLGVPIIINNRNKVRYELIGKNIFCPIHWKLSDEINKNEFTESWYLSEHLLTIPISENYGSSDLNYLIESLKYTLK